MSGVLKLSININSIMKINCGCCVPLHTLMFIMGRQIVEGWTVICPIHWTVHNYAQDDLMRHWACRYYEHCLAGSNEPMTLLLPFTLNSCYNRTSS